MFDSLFCLIANLQDYGLAPAWFRRSRGQRFQNKQDMQRGTESLRGYRLKVSLLGVGLGLARLVLQSCYSALMLTNVVFHSFIFVPEKRLSTFQI